MCHYNQEKIKIKEVSIEIDCVCMCVFVSVGANVLKEVSVCVNTK